MDLLEEHLFEGCEKRLEIEFKRPLDNEGMRILDRDQVNLICHSAKCPVVDQLCSKTIDSYLLSESSLFIYADKIIIKTCGRTTLLESIKKILEIAGTFSLSVAAVRYTRGPFLYPHLQPAQHINFDEEVGFLNRSFGDLTGEAYVAGHDKKIWHLYSAKAVTHTVNTEIMVEVTMTGLERDRANIFYKNKHPSPKDMTLAAGISDILPFEKILEINFEPCGHSVNALHGSGCSNIHVTPEKRSSYASYEAVGFDPNLVDFKTFMKRLLSCFEPKQFSLAIIQSSDTAAWGEDEEIEGYQSCLQVQENVAAGGRILCRWFEQS